MTMPLCIGRNIQEEAEMILPPATTQVTVSEYITLPGMSPERFDQSGTFLVSRKMLDHLQANGPPQKFLDALLISPTLEHPTVILEGLKRQNYHNGFCYCSVP